MYRRRFLQAGSAGLGVAGLAGCLDSGRSDDSSPDDGTADDASEGDDQETPAETIGTPDGDGIPPESAIEEVPDERSIDADEFDVLSAEGSDVTVPLVPLDVAYYWYRRREARFADARSREAYENAHITGAAHSPAGQKRADDPVDDWPTDARIVTYCRCPHTLAGNRAFDLLTNGYEEVYAIDEGFDPWFENGYPVTGRETDAVPELYTIEGRADGDGDGQAWAWHDPSGQREAAPIGADGSYELHLRFAGVTEESPIRIETPTYELEAPLGTLTEGVVTGQ